MLSQTHTCISTHAFTNIGLPEPRHTHLHTFMIVVAHVPSQIHKSLDTHTDMKAVCEVIRAERQAVVCGSQSN